MSNTFYLKRGDTSPSLLYALAPASTDLTGASVRFSMKSLDADAIKVNRAAAVIVTETVTPTVRYDWLAADTDEAGTFLAEFEVTYPGGAVETFPNSGFITVRILGDIA